MILAAAFAGGGRAAIARDAGSISGDDGQEVELTADRLIYDRTSSVLRADGHVVVKRGAEELKADRITAKTDTLDMWATGNVSYTTAATAWKGDSLYCNFDTGRVHANGKSEFRDKPFIVNLDKGDRVSTNGATSGRDAVVTTCSRDPGHYHYHIRARKVTIIPDGGVAATHVIFYYCGVPIMYVPYWRMSDNETARGFDFQPGYDSRFGPYLLSSYGYGISDRFSGRTRLDYRTKRGWAGGQDIVGTGADKIWAADLQTYYVYDKAHVGKEADPVDANRYRGLLKYRRSVNRDTYFVTRVHVLSDDEFLDDFFRDEFRLEPHPESYAYLKRNSDTYSVGGELRVRVNDFYDTVQRLPEAFVNASRQRIGNTFLYYDGRSSAGYLAMTVSKYSGADDYSAVRVDSRHVVSAPTRVWFLSAVPRAGYRATYYSQTPVDISESGNSPGAIDETGKNIIREMYEAGMDLSFKAFKVWRNPPGEDGGLRHVIEPYANYSYVSEPTVLAQDLYQFDQIDALRMKNEIRLGTRNKFQTKEKGNPTDKAYVDAWTVGNLEPDPGAYRFDTVGSDARFRLMSRLSVDVDGRYNFRGNGLRELNTHVVAGNTRKLHADVEHRYRADDRNLLLCDLDTDQNASWGYGYGTRYDLQEGRFQEHSVRLTRNFDCLAWTVGFSQLPGYTGADGTAHQDDYRVVFKIWIKALPGMGFGLE